MNGRGHRCNDRRDCCVHESGPSGHCVRGHGSGSEWNSFDDIRIMKG